MGPPFRTVLAHRLMTRFQRCGLTVGQQRGRGQQGLSTCNPVALPARGPHIVFFFWRSIWAVHAPSWGPRRPWPCHSELAAWLRVAARAAVLAPVHWPPVRRARRPPPCRCASPLCPRADLSLSDGLSQDLKTCQKSHCWCSTTGNFRLDTVVPRTSLWSGLAAQMSLSSLACLLQLGVEVATRGHSVHCHALSRAAAAVSTRRPRASESAIAGARISDP